MDNIINYLLSGNALYILIPLTILFGALAAACKESFVSYRKVTKCKTCHQESYPVLREVDVFTPGSLARGALLFGIMSLLGQGTLNSAMNGAENASEKVTKTVCNECSSEWSGYSESVAIESSRCIPFFLITFIIFFLMTNIAIYCPYFLAKPEIPKTIDKAPIVIASKKPVMVASKKNTKYTDIFAAIEASNLNAVKGFVRRNPSSVNKRDKIGFTPLHLASEKGYREIVELLISEGANINARDKYGGTPLHIASMNDHEGVAKLLRKHGARE